jgi:hypothetical protein
MTVLLVDGPITTFVEEATPLEIMEAAERIYKLTIVLALSNNGEQLPNVPLQESLFNQ